MVVGEVQLEESVMTVLVRHCENWSGLLKGLTPTNNENISILARSPRMKMMDSPCHLRQKLRRKERKLYKKNFFLVQGILGEFF
jgi:hypothetical protein